MLEEVLKSYSKINWVLEILSLRQDKYHNISSIFDILPFYDLIKIKLVEDDSWHVKISSNLDELEKKNIIYNLFDILQSFNGIPKYFVDINLQKNIPLGGGLGGGSSNAASILFFLYSKKIINLSAAIKLAKDLGSDVLPIFLSYLYPNNYIVCIEKQNVCLPVSLKIDLMKYFRFFIIVFPIKVETYLAYKEYDKIIRNKSFSIGPNMLRFFYYLKNNKNLWIEYFPCLVYNDFEKVVFYNYPLISNVRNEILENFKDAKVFLCGSGASLLVFFRKTNFIKNPCQEDFLQKDFYAELNKKYNIWIYSLGREKKY
ncbi:MAG: hypothetical protein ACK4GJ_06290 [bacterium]